MIDRVAGVLLTADDADYIARALELLERLLRENRSTPTPRLHSVTAKLRRTTDALGVSGRNGSATASVRASQCDSGDDADYGTITAAEAAHILGVTPNAVRDLARRQRIRARRPKGRWLLDAQAVVARAERQATRRAD